MKQLIIIFLLIITTFSTTATEPSVFYTESVQVDFKDGKGYTKELPVESLIFIDYDNTVIAIDTIEFLSINYVERYEYNNYKLLKCNAYDDNGTNCKVELWLYPKTFYLKVIYTNFIYKYKVNYY